MSLTTKTTIGIAWQFAEQLVRRGVGILVTLLLARYLIPEDFGLVAMMAVFIALGTSLMDSGFRQALIRMQDVDQIDFNTAFYTNLILGSIAYLLLYTIAPVISNFYQEGNLTLLIRVASLAILINAFNVVQAASLSRELNFKAQLRASFPAGVLGGIVAVYLAMSNWGTWALVMQMLITATVQTLLLWKIQRWRPSLTYSKASMRKMYNFGYKIFLANVLEIIFSNLYIILIAKYLSVSIAGLYIFADRIKELVVNQLFLSIQSVTYPALAKIQNDDIRLKSAYKKIISITTFLLFPALLFLAALAEPIFKLLLPAKWLPAAPYLQLMCLSSVLYPIHAINLNILKVKGRSDLFLYLEIIKKILITIVIIVSFKYGIYGILWGQVISSILVYVPNSYFSAKLINYPVSEQLKDFIPTLLATSIIAILGYLTSQHIEWHPLLQIIVIGCIMSIVYLVAAYFNKLYALTYIYNVIKTRIS